MRKDPVHLPRGIHPPPSTPPRGPHHTSRTPHLEDTTPRGNGGALGDGTATHTTEAGIVRLPRKIYYELVAKREELGLKNVAIVRMGTYGQIGGPRKKPGTMIKP